MRILVYSHDWAPSIGGVQAAMMSLAAGLYSALKDRDGHDELTLVTSSPAEEMDDHTVPFRVVRRPSLVDLIRLIIANDIIHLAGPAFIPLFLSWIFRKKVIIQHHNYQAVCPNGLLVKSPDRSLCSNHFLGGLVSECVRCHAINVGLRQSLWHTLIAYPRLWLALRAAANISVSNYAADRLSLPDTDTIYNGIQDVVGAVPRPETDLDSLPCIAYVGRLTPDKGVNTLITAAMQLHEQGCEFRLRIIGDGPERPALQGLVRFLELRHFIHFDGFLEGDDLARATSAAVAIVIPSLS